jgi:hypothetical protein
MPCSSKTTIKFFFFPHHHHYLNLISIYTSQLPNQEYYHLIFYILLVSPYYFLLPPLYKTHIYTNSTTLIKSFEHLLIYIHPTHHNKLPTDFSSYHSSLLSLYHLISGGLKFSYFRDSFFALFRSLPPIISPIRPHRSNSKISYTPFISFIPSFSPTHYPPLNHFIHPSPITLSILLFILSLHFHYIILLLFSFSNSLIIIPIYLP